MSWSVNASGVASEVRGQLSEQFKGPLAGKPAGLSDDGERETVQKVSELLEQITTTFDPERRIFVTANGHMGFVDWDKKTGCYQEMNIQIKAGMPV